ncbi:MAG: hypothetical protein ACRDIA_07370, partial [Actinomycetota bacterium]
GTSSLPEILEHPPATFNPEDPADISRLMEKALTDQELDRQLRAAAGRARARHTWTAVAEKTEAAVQSLDGFSSGRRRARKPRIAFAVRVEDLRTDGRLALARELSYLADLDMAVSGKTDFKPIRTATGGRCFPIEALGRWLNPAGYDAILYDAGGPALEQIADKASVYPGILMIDSMSPSQLYPASEKETSAIAKLMQSARGICAATQQQKRMLEMNLGPRVPMGPVLVLGQSSGPEAAARSVVDFVSRIPAA